MIDRSAAEQTMARRRSFRRRLLLTLGSALTLTFLLIGGVVWLGAYAWLTHAAQQRLQQEAEIVAGYVVGKTGVLRPDDYAWDEPHHLFADEHIDPFFLQVFDAQGKLRRASANIDALPPGSYPAGLLPHEVVSARSFGSLPEIEVAGRSMHCLQRPLTDADGRLVGTVQLARLAPPIGARMSRVGLLLFLGLGSMLAILLLILDAVARRVLRPLRGVVAMTQQITPDHLDRRFPLPDDADRESAQLVATLNRLLHRIEISFTEMQRFTTDAAHELQTPLTVLQGHVEVALRRSRSGKSYRQTLHTLADQIGQMTRMIRALLSLARLDQEHGLTSESTADLAEIARHIVESWQERAENKGIELRIQTPPSAQVWGDEDLLRECVIAVVENAVKYTPEGSIEVEVVEDGTRSRVAVTDTGIGIPPDALSHVTERFYRSRSVEALDVTGSGLGLSIVDRIVQLHGGGLQIESKPGGGTRIALWFHRDGQRMVGA